jgi:hypothetical protein
LSTSIVGTIREAISRKLLIEFTYEGGNRVVEPHVYGQKDGTEQLLAFQVQGDGSSDELPEWRRFDIGKMSNLKLTNDHFTGRRPTLSGEHAPFDDYFIVVS